MELQLVSGREPSAAMGRKIAANFNAINEEVEALKLAVAKLQLALEQSQAPVAKKATAKKSASDDSAE